MHVRAVWMDPVLTPRLEYLRWKHGFKGAAQLYSGYEVLSVSPRGWLRPAFGTSTPRKPGFAEARAVRRRLCSRRAVSPKLVRWAFFVLARMERDRERLQMDYDY